MSWNKFIYESQYKREDKFDYLEWLYGDRNDERSYNEHLFDMYLDFDWHDFGCPKNMKELGQYRLLTLLHKLHLKHPIKEIDRIGWY